MCNAHGRIRASENSNDPQAFGRQKHNVRYSFASQIRIGISAVVVAMVEVFGTRCQVRSKDVPAEKGIKY